MNTAILQREWKLQMARKAPGRDGGYPGLLWAAIALSLPLLHQAIHSYKLDFIPGELYISYELAGFLLITLTCLRACRHCAINLAEDIQSNSILLAQQLPNSGGIPGLLLTKIAVISLPLLLEWLLFIVMSGILWFMGTAVTEWNPLQFILVGLTSMLFFCSLGLWIGTRLNGPERASNSARIAVFMILIGWALLERLLKGPLLLIAALIWIAFLFRSSPRVASAFQGGVISAVIVLLLPQAYMLSDLRLAQLSPLVAASDITLTLNDCILYCVGAAALFLLNLRQLRKL